MKKEQNYRKLIIKIFNLRNKSIIEQINKLSNIMTMSIDDFLIKYQNCIIKGKEEIIIQEIELYLIELMESYIVNEKIDLESKVIENIDELLHFKKMNTLERLKITLDFMFEDNIEIILNKYSLTLDEYQKIVGRVIEYGYQLMAMLSINNATKKRSYSKKQYKEAEFYICRTYQ